MDRANDRNISPTTTDTNNPKSQVTQVSGEETEIQEVVIVSDDQVNQNTDDEEYKTPRPSKLKILKIKDGK